MALSSKILLCFAAAMLSTLIVRFALRSKRDLWFKRTQSSIINQRGMLGQYLSLGYPATRQNPKFVKLCAWPKQAQSRIAANSITTQIALLPQLSCILTLYSS